MIQKVEYEIYIATLIKNISNLFQY